MSNIKNRKIKVMNRNSNLELLRIISMVMIVTLHIITQGGLIFSINPLSFSYAVMELFQAISYVSVNCYVLISGYFLINSKFKFSKIFKIWLQVLFYSISIYIILLILNKIPFNLKELIRSMFPLTFGQYWFATVYIILYIASPILNTIMRTMSEAQVRLWIFVMILLFSISPIKDSIGVQDGYSLYWFICLYCVGAYIRLYYKPKYIYKKYLFGFIFATGIDYIVAMTSVWITVRLFGVARGMSYFLAYNWIGTFIASVCLFIFILNLEVKSQKVNKYILSFSTLTFGVYLIHVNPHLSKVIWNEILVTNRYLEYRGKFFIYMLMVISLYLVCSFIEYIRQRVFNNIYNIIFSSKLVNKILSLRILLKLKSLFNY